MQNDTQMLIRKRKKKAIILRLEKSSVRRLDKIAREISYDRNFPINKQLLILEALRRVFFEAEKKTLLKKAGVEPFGNQIRVIMALRGLKSTI